MKLPRLIILFTAVGCPGGVTLIRALKNNGEREIEIIGTDMRPEASGRFFADRFYTVTAGNSPDFIPQFIDIVDRERPDVIFPQSSYEVYPLALNRDAFDVPISDGTPVSVLEAFACGVPVIASDLPSLREWITTEQSGLLVPEGNSKALAQAIIRLLNDRLLYTQIQTRALQIVRDHADHARWMAHMEDLYTELTQ